MDSKSTGSNELNLLFLPLDILENYILNSLDSMSLFSLSLTSYHFRKRLFLRSQSIRTGGICPKWKEIISWSFSYGTTARRFYSDIYRNGYEQVVVKYLMPILRI